MTNNIIKLTDQGNANITIMYSSKTDSPVPAYAAYELQKYIKKISGANVSVMHSKYPGGGLSDSSNVSSMVIITTNENMERQISDEDISSVENVLADKKADTFLIHSSDESIYLTGTNHRGTLYAVYAFLEQLGIRFHAPNFPFYEEHGEYVPHAKTISVQPIDCCEEPSLKYRIKHVDEGGSLTRLTFPQMIEWMGKKRLNTIVIPKDHQGFGNMLWENWRVQLLPELEKRDITLEIGGHGYQSFLPESEYKEKYPEWFPDSSEPVIGPRKTANVFRFTNNDALQTYIQNVIDYLKRFPEAKAFHAWPPDAATWAVSDLETCGGTVANAQAYITNHLIKEMKKVLPHVRIETLSYSFSIDSPDPEYQYDEATILDYAANKRSYEVSIFEHDKEQNAFYRDILSKWRNNGFKGDIRIYEYYIKYIWRSLPIHLPRLIVEDISNYYRDFKIDGLGVYCEAANWLTYELTHRLTADISWDAELDLETYMERFLTERFPHIKTDMKAYYEHCEEAGRTLFDFCQGKYDDENRVSKALHHYHMAKKSLLSAKQETRLQAAESFLLGRLLNNIDYAVAIIEISYFRLLEDTEREKIAQQRAKQLIDELYLQGIVFKTFHSIRRYESEFDDRSLSYKLYGEAW